MSLASKLLAASGGSAAPLYVDDVFSSFLYTTVSGNDVVTNGIDLAGKGGMVWTKCRTNTNSHYLGDTANAGAAVSSNTTQAITGYAAYTFQSNGFTEVLGTSSGLPHISWTFRKAPKFFDVVTYTGNGSNRTISHSLGQEVGLIFVKRTDSAADWQVYHRSLANTEYAVLNSTAAKATGATRWNSTTPTSSVFSVGTDTTVNATGGTYVAYLFAHDTATDGLIQCGGYTGTAVAGNFVSLGWEPQYVLIKANSNESWLIYDSARGVATGGVDAWLKPDQVFAESPQGDWIDFNATGFTLKETNNNVNGSGIAYIYLAIRRPNKPPTTGTQVYNAIARTGTGAAATVTGVGFAPDLLIGNCRNTSVSGYILADRLRGTPQYLLASSISLESSSTNVLSTFDMAGGTVGAGNGLNGSGNTYINHFFKRAPGVFDVVCYTGTGVARTVAHSLGAAPELFITKRRDIARDWGVMPNDPTKFLFLNSTGAITTNSSLWNNTAPTASVFTVGTDGSCNAASGAYVAYLFATKAGISKVGSYTGNGSSQTLNMGFTTGARFFMCKRIDSTGDWYVWDSVRGIVAGNDPHLSLNTTAAEVTTDDSVDPDTSGLIVNQVAATNINVTSATYIYLAFA